jgi:hypothetical protein
MSSVISDRDIDGRPLRNNGSRWWVLANDEPVLVWCANEPPHLAQSEPVPGKFMARCGLASVRRSQPQQVRDMPVIRMVPDVVPSAECPSDHGKDDEREHHAAHEMTMRRPPAGRQGPRLDV